MPLRPPVDQESNPNPNSNPIPNPNPTWGVCTPLPHPIKLTQDVNRYAKVYRFLHPPSPPSFLSGAGVVLHHLKTCFQPAGEKVLAMMKDSPCGFVFNDLEDPALIAHAGLIAQVRHLLVPVAMSLWCWYGQ